MDRHAHTAPDRSGNNGNTGTVGSGGRAAALPDRRPGRPLADRVAGVTAWLEEHKAEAVVSLDVSGENAFADAMVVATATSMRHAQGLADGVMALCHDNGDEFLGLEGYAAAQWILADLNDIIIHILLAPVREQYRLEDLWGRDPGRPGGHPASAPGSAGGAGREIHP